MFLSTYVEARRQAVLSGWFSSSSLFGAKEYAPNNINNLSYAAGGRAIRKSLASGVFQLPKLI